MKILMCWSNWCLIKPWLVLHICLQCWWGRHGQWCCFTTFFHSAFDPRVLCLNTTKPPPLLHSPLYSAKTPREIQPEVQGAFGFIGPYLKRVKPHRGRTGNSQHLQVLGNSWLEPGTLTLPKLQPPWKNLSGGDHCELSQVQCRLYKPVSTKSTAAVPTQFLQSEVCRHCSSSAPILGVKLNKIVHRSLSIAAYSHTTAFICAC